MEPLLIFSKNKTDRQIQTIEKFRKRRLETKLHILYLEIINIIFC